MHGFDGRIQYWNPAAEMLYGRSAAAGAFVFEFLPAGWEDEYRALIQRLIAGETPIRLVSQRCTAAGRQLDVELILSVVADAHGQPSAVISMERDVSEGRRDHLDRSDQDLERRVAVRTAELMAANGALQAEIDRREEAESALEEAIGWLRGITTHAPVVITLKDRSGVYQRINRQLALLVEREPEAIIGRRDADIFPSAVAERMARNDARVIEDQRALKAEERVVGPGGERHYLSVKFPVFTSSGELQGVGCVATDITDLRRYQAQLDWEREKAQVTLSSIGEGVLTCDSQCRVDYMNAVAESLTQWSCEEAVGRSLAEVLRVLDERTRQPVDVHRYCAPGGCRFSADAHHVVVGRDGASLPVQETATPIRGRDGSPLGAVIILRDVSASRQLARRLSYEATHDPLTGLINRAEFNRVLQNAIDEARREGQQHVLCFIDLDGFKPVNDRAGHAAGDELLRRLSAALRNELRVEDKLGRLGGDEFGVLLHGCGIEAAERLAEGLRQTVEAVRFAWRGMVFQVTASIGLTPIRADSGGFEAVRAAADDACYAAKESGRNQVRVHGVQARVPRREDDWRARLEQALGSNGFRLLCQPIISLGGGISAHWGEVLLRMQGENGNLLPPGSFLPVAERYGLSANLDRWVVDHVFAVASAHEEHVLTINLSAQVLENDGFIDFIDTLVSRYKAQPARYCFEFNEVSVATHFTRAQRLLTQLKRRGFLLSLDRFGTGYASFDYLKRLPVDFLKIDGEFVRDMCRDSLDFTMVDSLNHIAHALNKHSVAGRVHDTDVLAELRLLGVDWAQGFALAHPQPLEEFVGRRQ